LNVLETEQTGAQLVITRPNVAPVVEKGYEITVKGQSAVLRPIDQISQEYEKAGDLVGRSAVSLKAPSGAMDFKVEMRTGGLVIEPRTPEAAKFVEENRTAVIGAGAIEVISNLKIPADMIRTIFINIPPAF
jgi:hypothetical protein